MKLFYKSVIFLLTNFIILRALAHGHGHSHKHEHNIHISQDVTECKDNKDPIYILDEESLGGVGHGNHNYISVCPEDVSDYQQKVKRSFKPKFNFLDGERHNFEYEKPYVNDIFDKSYLNPISYMNKNTIDTGEFEFNEEDTINNIYSAFKIEFYCSETPNLCEKAKYSFEKATQKIAIALKIKTPIVVQASLYSFCKYKGGSYCSNKSSSIGSAAASAYHILNNNGTKYLYPQPLVKQLDDMGIYLTTDITSDFNSDYSFYFSGDNQIEDGQIDFEYVVIHELIHGLGFATAFQKYFSLVAKVIEDQDFLSPGLSLINNTYVSSWRSIQIFDKNIVSTEDNMSLDSYNNDIMKFSTPSRLLSPLEYHNEFVRSVGPYNAAKHILNVASNATGSLVFKTSEGEDIVLYTKDNEFLQGTSIAHLADSYKYSSDFIMISDVSPLQGKTLSQMYYEFGDNNPYGALGPNVLKILKEIGWEIANEPTNIGNFYVINEMLETKSSSISKYIIPTNNILLVFIIYFIYNFFN